MIYILSEKIKLSKQKISGFAPQLPNYSPRLIPVKRNLKRGAVTIWEPLHRLAFTWYLGSGQQLPTRVDVQFIALNDNQTRVELEHRGPELIGDLWAQRVTIFNSAWAAVLAKLQLFLAGKGSER